MDPSDEQENRAVVEAEAFAQPCALAPAGAEHGVIDAGGDDLDPRRLRAVERGELQPLFGRGREHQVGALDGLVLETRALLGLVVETGFGLHARERVERRDERTVDRVLEPVTDRAGDPVVGVQDVVVVAGAAHPVEHGVGERVDEAREVVQRDRTARPDIDVHDTESVLDRRDRRGIGVFATREDIAFDTRVRESRGQGADVDVHPAAVAGSRLREGRRVNAEDGNPANRHTRTLPGDLSLGPR